MRKCVEDYDYVPGGNDDEGRRDKTGMQPNRPKKSQKTRNRKQGNCQSHFLVAALG